MSDEQFNKLTAWIGDCIGGFFDFLGDTFQSMSVEAWSIVSVAAVVIGFLCMKSMRASERM